MGVETVKLAESKDQVQEFIKYLLKDIRAMERMLEDDLFETDIVRIGAEQELCLVDKYAKPAPISMALFHQSVDTRQVGEHLRDSSPRVTFGNEWLKNSILDIYKEDIARYRVILSSNVNEDADEILDRGEIPKLMALQVHNGTVYRWNRPCYGVSNGKPHLRIENRIFPSGPTVTDEIANASFWLGLLNGMEVHYPDISRELDFDDARMNFIAASKLGLDTKFKWVNDKRYTAVELITQELLPIAREGLEKAGVNKGDITSYLDIIKERTEAAQTGSYWMVKSYNSLTKKDVTREQALTASLLRRHHSENNKESSENRQKE